MINKNFLTPNNQTASGITRWRVALWVLVSLAIGYWLLVIMSGCARIVPPDGGPKDTLAPTLVRSNPAQGSLNFKEKRISMEFSEPIQVGTINTQLLIAPVTDNPYTYTIRKGRILELEFEKPFPDSVTMNLNFRDAIKDITESNLAKNLVLAFATGPMLDTMAVAGQVKDLMTSLPVPDAVVGLWLVSDTMSIQKQKPQYLTRTDKEGRYVLLNVRKARYFLAAFLDKNGNSRWSGKEEGVGFPSADLVLTRDSVVGLNLAPVDEAPPRVFSLRVSQDSLGVLSVNEGLIRARVAPATGADSLPYLYSLRENRITFRLPKGLGDSTAFRFALVDSARNRTDTVVGLRLRQPDSKRRRDRDEETAGYAPRFALDARSAGNATIPEPHIFRFGLNEPSTTAQPLRPLRWQRDSATRAVELKGYFTDAFRTSYAVVIPRLGYAQGRLLIDTGAFRSAWSGQYNRADTIPFTILNSETAGIIRGVVKDMAPPLIVELMDEQGKVIDTLRNKTRFEFRNLVPANYRLRFIQDANNNGRWDQGSYRERRQPERITTWPDIIKVKANWEVELE